MFRIPVKKLLNEFASEGDSEQTVYDEDSSSISDSKSKDLFFMPVKINSNDHIKENRALINEENYKRNEFRLRAEIELLKNDIENEKLKNETLLAKIQEKDSTIEMLKKNVKDKQNEIRVSKKENYDLIIEFTTEKNKIHSGCPMWRFYLDE